MIEKIRIIPAFLFCFLITGQVFTQTVCSNDTVFAGNDTTLDLCTDTSITLYGWFVSDSAYFTGYWSGGQGTFIPGREFNQPTYIPTQAEIDSGTVNLFFKIGDSTLIEYDYGLLAYDHYSQDSFLLINPSDGAIKGLRENANDDVMAAACDVNKRIVYAVNGCTGSQATSLYKMNLLTNQVTHVKNYTNKAIYAMAFDNENKILYAVSMEEDGTNVPQTLHILDTADGTITDIGSLGVNGTDDFCRSMDDGIGGLAYDRSTGKLFGISTISNLYEIDTATGNATLIGNLNLGWNQGANFNSTGNWMVGLAYDFLNNILYGNDRYGNLYIIDKTNATATDSVLCQGVFERNTALTYINDNIYLTNLCRDSVSITLNMCPADIELMYFKGRHGKNVNYIEWATSSEENNNCFHLEKSTNGTDFKVIANITGAGNSNTVKSYSYIDKNITQKINYYRLKQTDFDGSFEYSDIIQITGIPERMNTSPDVNIIADNSNNIITVRILEDIESRLDICIYNILGETAWSGSIAPGEENNYKYINISGFDNGIYFIKITGPPFVKSFTEKFLIMNQKM